MRSLVAAAFALSAVSAHALSVDPAYDRFKAVLTGNTVNVAFSSTGTPLAGSGGPLTATGTSAGAFLSRSASVATQHGPLPFTVSQRFTVASLAKGVAAIAFNPLVGVGLAIASPYIYQWLSDSGVTSQNGQLGTIEGGDSDGLDWSVDAAFNRPQFIGPTPQAACDLLAGSLGTPMVVVGDPSYPLCFRANGLGGTYKLYSRHALAPESPGTFTPATQVQVQDKLAATPRTDSEIERILAEGIKYPELVPDVADTPQILNPQPSAARQSSSTTRDPVTGGTTQTRSCSMIGSPSSSGNQMTVSEICTTTTTTTPPGGGTPTTVTGTTTTGIGVTVGSGTPSETPPFEMPCGVGSAPPCAVKVDETGVRSTVTMADPFPQLEQTAQTQRDEIAAADGSAWEPIKDFFFLPPSTACVPFDMPSVYGMAVPQVDPCGVVPGIRQVVGVIWSIVALWIMVGWIREVL